MGREKGESLTGGPFWGVKCRGPSGWEIEFVAKMPGIRKKTL